MVFVLEFCVIRVQSLGESVGTDGELHHAHELGRLGVRHAADELLEQGHEKYE